MIKALIFDADGPLYYRTDNVTEELRSLLAEFGYHDDIKEFRRAYEIEKFKAYDRTESEVAMDQNILRTIGIKVSRAGARQFAEKFDAVQQQVTAAADATATLRRLKSEGYKICVLTDSFHSSKEKWSWFKSMAMDTYLDYIVSSYDIRKLKDTPEAYRACLNDLGVKASEAMFVGHQQYEMVGALAAKVASVAILPIATPNIQADYTIGALSELPSLLKRVKKTTLTPDI